MPAHGTSSQRGYGWQHQKIRAQYLPMVAAGKAICWRCGERIKPSAQWDLGHDDDDRTKYRGPEHALAKDCKAGGNRATSGRNRKGYADHSRDW